MVLTQTRGTNLDTELLEFRHMMRSLVSKVGPFFIECKCPFSTLIQVDNFARCKAIVFYLSRNHTVLTKKIKTNLETKLLEVRRMSREEFFYIGLPNSISKPGIFLTCLASSSIDIGMPYSYCTESR